MNAALDPAVDRFQALDEEAAEDFRDKLQAHCSLYGFLAQIVPFSDVGLEKLYAFGKMLLRKLPRKGDTSPKIELGDDVALHCYRLQKEAEGSLELRERGTGYVPGPAETGTGQAQEQQEKLSNLIDSINQRFGTDFDAQDLIDGVTEQLVADESLQQAATASDKENFRYVLEPALDEALIDRHAKHASFIDKVFSDRELLSFLRRRMLNEVYRQLRPDSSAP